MSPATSRPTGAARPAAATLLATLLAALVALATLVVATSPADAEVCPPAATPAFSDVGLAHPFCREIQSAHKEGLVHGYPDGTFRPTDVVTRQAAAAILWRTANNGALVVPAPCVAAPFPDVPVDHPFCPEIRDAALAGVFTGYADGTFKPGAPMTRLATAMVLARFPEGPMALLACGGGVAPFSDIPTDHPQCTQIQYVKGAGLLTGYADGEFKPGNPMTRQAFAAVAVRALLLPS